MVLPKLIASYGAPAQKVRLYKHIGVNVNSSIPIILNVSVAIQHHDLIT